MTVETMPDEEAVVLRFTDGSTRPLALDRWTSSPSAEERALLDGVVPPVLDIGCGPGRHVVELAARGLVVLGIDTSPAAVMLTREKGGAALERSVFASIPGAGRWQTALLMDGNVGIGGDPAALLHRVNFLLAFGGKVVAEVESPETPTRYLRARLERRSEISAWFPWAVVGASGIGDIARRCRFRVETIEEREDRWFAILAKS